MVGEPGAPGVIPRAFDLIWDQIDASPSTEWHVSVTCAELYNEGFRDLLAHAPPPDTATPFAMEAARRAQGAILLREAKSARGGPPVAYLTGSDTFRHPVPSRAAMAGLLARALAARHISATAFNQRSSRSHVLITVNLDSKVGSHCHSPPRLPLTPPPFPYHAHTTAPPEARSSLRFPSLHRSALTSDPHPSPPPAPSRLAAGRLRGNSMRQAAFGRPGGFGGFGCCRGCVTRS
jgi:hypothetical protein